MKMTYTIEVGSPDETIWQAVVPTETIETYMYPHILATKVAGAQNVVDDDYVWRIRIWEGAMSNALTSTRQTLRSTTERGPGPLPEQPCQKGTNMHSTPEEVATWLGTNDWLHPHTENPEIRKAAQTILEHGNDHEWDGETEAASEIITEHAAYHDA